MGWTVVGEYSDNDVSAYKSNSRPGYEQMLTRIITGAVDVVVVRHIDRLFRRDRERLRFYDVCLAARTYLVAGYQEGVVNLRTAACRKLFRDRGSDAEYASDVQGERIREKHDRKFEKGEWAGGPRPFGYRPGGKTLIIDEREAELVRHAAGSILDDRATYNSIAREWNEKGILTPRGNRWRGSTVAQMLRSPHLAGIREHNGRSGPGNWEPILDEGTVQAFTARHDKGRVGSHAGAKYLLAGLLTCERCGHKLYPQQYAKRPFAYACDASKDRLQGCGRLRIQAAALERHVSEQLYFAEQMEEMYGKREASPDPLAELDVKIATEKAKLREFADAFERDEIDASDYRQKRESVTARLNALKEERARLAEPIPEEPLSLADMDRIVREYEADPVGYWAKHPDSLREMRAAIRHLWSRIVVKPSEEKRGSRAFDPGRVVFEWRSHARAAEAAA